MGAIALGSPWLQSRSGFSMGTIALGSLWLIQIRISHRRHRGIALGSPWLIHIVFCCALPDFVDSESDIAGFTCFACAGVIENLARSTVAYTWAMIFPSSVTRK